MVELLLNIIYACRTGLWDLLLECISEVIPYAFAYDHVNYSRYLTVMLGDMLALEKDFPEIYEQFLHGNFTAQLTEGMFNRVETDKVIEMTLNKDTKTPGGTTGFSTSLGAVQRWEINASYRASLREVFHQHLNYSTQRHKHKDLSPSRIKKDENDIKSILSILQQTFVDPFSEQQLLSISRGIVLDDTLAQRMLSAKEVGSEAMAAFIKDRLCEDHTMSIFDPIKKQKLPTFGNISKSKSVRVKEKLVTIQNTKDLFAKVAIIAQKRAVDLRQLLSFPLIELPLSLAEPDGTLKKTAKSRLLHAIEGETPPVDMLQKENAFIADGMAYVRQIKVSGLTFDQFSTKLLSTIINSSCFATRIDVVFDVYLDVSIKDVERHRRSTGEIAVKKIVSSAPIKQWGQLLSSGDFKNKLVTFILHDWQSKRNLLKNRTLFVNDAVETWCYKSESIELAEHLLSNQEEADTRMLLHAKDAGAQYEEVVISSPDTDVFAITLSKLSSIDANMYMLTGTGDKKRLIDLNAVAENSFLKLNRTDCTKEKFLEALPGFHCFTGCDSTSAFSGRGKIKPLKLLGQKNEYIDAFASLGSDWEISSSTMEILQSFVCHMYGKKDALQSEISLDDLRYDIYCRKGGKVSSETLPPCVNVFEQHVKRVNFQTKTWKSCLNTIIERGDPSQHGWGIDDSGLFIKWMTCKPAIEEVRFYAYLSIPNICRYLNKNFPRVKLNEIHIQIYLIQYFSEHRLQLINYVVSLFYRYLR